MFHGEHLRFSFTCFPTEFVLMADLTYLLDINKIQKKFLNYLNLKVSRFLGTFVSTLLSLYKAEARSKDFETSP